MIESAICVVYSDYSFLDSCLQSVNNKIDTMYFIVPFCQWNGEKDEASNEKVIEIINKYLESNSNWELIRKDFTQQAQARNYALSLAEKKYSYSMIIDSDEIWDIQDLNKLEKLIISTNYDVYACQMHTYFKNLKWKIHPPQNLEPVVAVRTNTRFDKNRHPISKKSHTSKDIYMHHPSHVRTDEEMLTKIKCCQSCSDKKMLLDWYNNVWKNWKPTTRNFHPAKPDAFRKVIEVTKQDVPESLQKYIN